MGRRKNFVRLTKYKTKILGLSDIIDRFRQF